MAEDDSLGKYIGGLRKRRGITTRALGYGICSHDYVSRIENGGRNPKKQLKDRILARLGVVSEAYEKFLNYQEYAEHILRQEMHIALAKGNSAEALDKLDRLLATYTKDKDYRFNRQFELNVRGQVFKLEKAGSDIIGQTFFEALNCTVPDILGKDLNEYVLSVEEVDLLIEVLGYMEVDIDWYRTVFDYIKSHFEDHISRAKIFPKAVVFFLHKYTVEYDEGIRLCEDAIDMLRDCGRVYYLYELLTYMLMVRAQAPECYYKSAIASEVPEWFEVLEELYRRVNLSPYTCCNSYIYLEQNVYRIGDVLHDRRKMLGMSIESLAMGICDARTVIRLENNKAYTHPWIVKELFDRLNIPSQFYIGELICVDDSARKKINEAREYIKGRDLASADETLKSLGETPYSFEKYDRQVIARMDLMVRFNKKQLTAAEAVNEFKKILGLTVDFDRMAAADSVFLTKEEILCLHKILKVSHISDSEHTARDQSIVIFRNFYEKSPMSKYTINYDFVFRDIASTLGDLGMYSESDKLSHRIMSYGMLLQRIVNIERSIYTMYWNKCEQTGSMNIDAQKKELNICCSISKFRKDESHILFFREKLIRIDEL